MILHDRFCKQGEKCIEKELKAEAVKWVKSDQRVIRTIIGYKKERIGTGGDFSYITNPITRDIFLDNNVKLMIKHLFNLTEEDLK